MTTVSQWLPIESAPKTGGDILLYFSDSVHEGRWMWESRDGLPDGWYWSGYNKAVGPISPTLWMRLPEPPAKEQR